MALWPRDQVAPSCVKGATHNLVPPGLLATVPLLALQVSHFGMFTCVQLVPSSQPWHWTHKGKYEKSFRTVPKSRDLLNFPTEFGQQRFIPKDQLWKKDFWYWKVKFYGSQLNTHLYPDLTSDLSLSLSLSLSIYIYIYIYIYMLQCYTTFDHIDDSSTIVWYPCP